MVERIKLEEIEKIVENIKELEYLLLCIGFKLLEEDTPSLNKYCIIISANSYNIEIMNIDNVSYAVSIKIRDKFGKIIRSLHWGKDSENIRECVVYISTWDIFIPFIRKNKIQKLIDSNKTS